MGSLEEVFVYVTYGACVCMLVVYLMSTIRKGLSSDVHRLPASPPGWPILGHLHLLQQPLHHCLHKLAQLYGPLFYLQLGSISTVVISSPRWAKEFLHAHDGAFVDRPRFEASKRLLYNNKCITMMNHSPAWRHLRRLYMTHILAAKRVEAFEEVRQDEVALLLKLIQRQASVEGGTVNIRSVVFSTLGNMFTRMLYSKRSFDVTEASGGRGRRFDDLLHKSSALFTTPVLGDVLPWLAWLDRGTKRRMDGVAKELDAFLEEVLQERMESKGQDRKDEEAWDFLDLLLSLYHLEDGQLDKESIKGILLDLLGAGIETMTTTIEWAMAELLRNPRCLQKLQEELDTRVVASEASMADMKCLKDADLAKLSYLQAVFKETLRLHPPVTVNYRELSDAFDQGIQVGGYNLPKKTRVLVNHWALGRDPAIWGTNADTFSPERFLGKSEPDVRGKHFELLPFGTGRRGCPGMNIALTVVPFVIANLVQVVNWSIPNGILLILSESSGLTTPMAKSLEAKPSLRASNGAVG